MSEKISECLSSAMMHAELAGYRMVAIETSNGDICIFDREDKTYDEYTIAEYNELPGSVHMTVFWYNPSQ